MLFPVILVTVIGALAGILLAVASKVFAVPVDEKFGPIRECLPGANCGACGFAGCDDYANALVAGTAKPNQCTVGGAAVAAQIAEILGVDAGSTVPMAAVVRCCGNNDNTGLRMDYVGRQTCAASAMFFQGRGACPYTCIGFGDCVNVCNFDAIHVVNGVAYVDKASCVGCGMCAKVCPHHLIAILPKSSRVYVGCSSQDKGALVRKACKVGCIGCKKCERTCPTGAIKVENNLASINPELCTNCGTCVEGCPTGAIKMVKDLPCGQQA